MAAFSNVLGNDLSTGQPSNDLSSTGTASTILGALMVAQWHASVGIALVSGVNSWTDSIGSRVLSPSDAAHRPPYGPDGAHYGGKSVPITNKAGALILRGSGLAVLAANGTRPYLYFRGRFLTAVTASADTIIGVASAGADTMTVQILPPSQSRVFYDGAVSLTGPVIDTNVHDFEVFKDGVNKNFVVDGFAYTLADAGTIAADMVQFAVGTSGSVNSNQADASVPLIVVCSAAPTAQQRADLKAWGAREFAA